MIPGVVCRARLDPLAAGRVHLELHIRWMQEVRRVQALDGVAAVLGMVLTACTLTIAWLGDGLIRRVRALRPHIRWVSAVVLWLAGAYVLYYSAAGGWSRAFPVP